MEIPSKYLRGDIRLPVLKKYVNYIPFYKIKKVKQKVQFMMMLQYQASISTEINISPDIRWNRTIQVIIIH